MGIDRERWAMVTGSSSGIGRATALALAEEGWNVGVHYRRSEESARAIADRILELGRRSELFGVDLGSLDAGPGLVEDVWRRTGGADAWVHLAGVDLLTGPQAKASYPEKLDRLYRVDLAGTILTCKEVGRRMYQRGSGSIVTVGWDQSATGMEGDSGELFGAIKGGVAAFSRGLAQSLAPAVRVNCVAPGWIQTAWGEQASQAWQDRVRRETPLGRWGTPRDVAAVITFLVSDRARSVTGQTVNVNGGAVMGG